jgi:hypothetical protein
VLACGGSEELLSNSRNKWSLYRGYFTTLPNEFYRVATTQPRLIAAKFAGQRGSQFTQWAKEYLDAAAGKGDEDASWADCYLGHAPQAGLSAVQTRRRTQRRRESYSALLQHMDDDSLKAVIRAEAGPLAVNPQDRSNGRVAWLVIQRECDEPASAFHIKHQDLVTWARRR